MEQRQIGRLKKDGQISDRQTTDRQRQITRQINACTDRNIWRLDWPSDSGSSVNDHRRDMLRSLYRWMSQLANQLATELVRRQLFLCEAIVSEANNGERGEDLLLSMDCLWNAASLLRLHLSFFLSFNMYSSAHIDKPIHIHIYMYIATYAGKDKERERVLRPILEKPSLIHFSLLSRCFFAA